MNLRPALPHEAALLSEIAFVAKSHWGYPVEWMELWSPDLTITPSYLETEKVSVAEDERKVIGFVGLSAGDHGRHIEHMWLRPAYIGRGLGRQLFGETIRLALIEHARELFIQADPKAEAFYIRMGAIRIGQEVYELPGGVRREIPLLVYRLT